LKDYSAIALDYCNDIISGKTIACQKVVQACQRQLNDLEKSKLPDYPYKFDTKLANKRCAFSEKLPHVKGKWRGKKLVLSPYQVFWRCCVWGWIKKKGGMRRFRTVAIFLPRKQGKSVDGADTGLYMLVADNELGAEIYSGASTERQALEVFRPAWQMVEMMPEFREHFGISLSGTPKNPTSIYKLSDLSRFELVIGKPPDGASPSCAIIDEYHQHATSEQRDAMRTGMGARSQPLLVIITTAGTDTSLPCYDEYLYALKVLNGTIEDDTYFALIFAKDDDQDEKDFEIWKVVNPNYGISIDEDFLKGAYNEAMTIVSMQNINYCRHLNLWTNAGVGWMSMPKWAACCDPTLDISQFKGQPCYVALDLASKIDICALVILFEGKQRTITRMLIDPTTKEEVEREITQKDFVVFGKYYLPEETIQLAGNDHYIKWVKEGWIVETPGARTDFLYIENDLKGINIDHPIIELAFDPREATYLINNVQEWLGSHQVDGQQVSRCVEITQGPALMSEPMKETEARIYSQTLLHTGDPVMTWMMGNVVKKQGRMSGPVKYYYPTKEKNEFKIDSSVCIIMAVSRAMKKIESLTGYEGLTVDQIIARISV